jgi:polysaccharide biosynthesis protein PslG
MSTPLVPVPSPSYGVGAHFLGYPESTERDVQLMTGAGLGWVKLTVPWRSIETDCKNCIDWTALDAAVGAASAAGLKIMARIDHHPAWSRVVPAENGPPDDIFDYSDFVAIVAGRYGPSLGRGKGIIQAIQVWNEPNLNREWGGAVIDRNQASQYMFMLKETYTAVKQVDPQMIIVSAGLSPTGTNDGTAMDDATYLEWMYDSDLLLYSDVIGVHAPGYGSPPDAEINSNPTFPHPSFYFRRVEQLHNIMAAWGDVNKQAWVLEFGWTTDTVHPDRSFYAVTPEQQADYLVRAFKYAKANWSPWMGVMFIWNMPDPTWTDQNEQLYWSIINNDGTPRPAYDAIKAARASGELP